MLMDGVSDSGRRMVIFGGLLLGLGLGGFFDGIVLHQILQWHHMISSVADYPVTTLEGLEANTLGDGLFHAATYLLTAAGLVLLWRGAHRVGTWRSARLMAGLLLMGWGTFNVIEGIVDHHLLQLHHVRSGANQNLWDAAFLIWGAAMLIGGWLLARTGDREVHEFVNGARPVRQGPAVRRSPSGS